eukprot:CAMPEP_0201661360 /NCGR_PEP_ID=MMETSP0494-20130426/3746_1 /ASSEMBLY_ACC=CAM_ASM_000839 /TAXON_ID=420259 /ORGANISM="Thalassiosira gravida, Strain GMp14c1" /LENGTH=631 /DNA_ID=CAMNT_0048139447 /DNA_START=73 /DNA_END=1968 /DNA_ORIENTATION=+
MKTAPILLSLAMGVTAQNAKDVANGNIRATNLATKKTDRNLAASTATDNAAATSTKDRATRDKRSQRVALGNSLHKKLFNKEGDRELKEANNKKKKNNTKNNKKNNKNKKAAAKTQEMAESRGEDTGKEEKDRELKKTKSGKEDGDMGGSWWGGDGRGGDGHFGRDDDDYHGGILDDDRFGHGDDRFGHGMGHSPDWRGGGGSKSGKAGGNYGSWGGSKSGKAGGNYGGKAGGDYGGRSGKANKSGKAGGDYGDGGGGAECHDGDAYVTVTNVSFQQSFSEIFAMTATYDVTWRKPVFEFGEKASDALAILAEEANAAEMALYYNGLPGVEQVKIFRDFGLGSFDEKFLRGGSATTFRVNTSGYGHRLTLAMGLPFTNDGAVVLEAARIYDGAEYWISPIDTGTEGNIQTCWSVAAMQEDFPFQAECADDNLADLNDNSIPGETFVSMHRGIADLEKNNNELEDLLLFPTCDDLDLETSNRRSSSNDGPTNPTARYAEYFFEVGYDDEVLLCQNRGLGGNDCDYRDDGNFLDFIDRSNEYDGEDDRFIRLAQESTDFEDFCDLIVDANRDLEDAFTTLESHIFDWRNEIAHVQIHCGWHGDDWNGDDHYDDDHHDDVYHDDDGWMGGMHRE